MPDWNSVDVVVADEQPCTCIQKICAGGTRRPAEATCLAFSPNGRWLAFGLLDGRAIMRLVNVESARVVAAASMQQGKAEVVLCGHEGKVTGVCWTPDGSHLCSCSEDRTIRLWSAADANLGRCTHCLTRKLRQMVVKIPSRCQPGCTFDVLYEPCKEARTAPSKLRQQVVLGCIRLNPDETLWQVEQPTPIQLPATGELHEDDGSTAYTAEMLEMQEVVVLRGEQRLLSLQSDVAGDPKFPLYGPRAPAVHFSGELEGSEYVAQTMKMASQLRQLSPTELNQRTRPVLTQVEAKISDVSTLIQLPPGRGGGEVWRVEVPDGCWIGEELLVKSWTGHTGSVLALAWAPDGETLATGSSDGIVLLWSRELSPLGSITAVMPARNGGRYRHQTEVRVLCWLTNSVLLLGGQNLIPQLWDASGSSPVHLLDLHDGHHGRMLQGCTAATATRSRVNDDAVLQHYYPRSFPPMLPPTDAGAAMQSSTNNARGKVSPAEPSGSYSTDKESSDRVEQRGEAVAAQGSGKNAENGVTLLAVAGMDADSAVVRIYAVSESAQMATTLAVLDDGRPEPVVDCQFAPGSLYIALAAGQTVAIWDVSSLHHPDPELGLWCCCRLTQHTSEVAAIAWRPTLPPRHSACKLRRTKLSSSTHNPRVEQQMRSVLASASLDCTLRVWKLGTNPSCPEPRKRSPEVKSNDDGHGLSSMNTVDQTKVIPLDEALRKGLRAVLGEKLLDTSVVTTLGSVPGFVARSDSITSECSSKDYETGAEKVKRQLHSLLKLIRALRRIEKAEEASPLRGLHVSQQLVDLWRCYLPLAQRIADWKAARDEATGCRTPLLIGVAGAAGCGRSTFVNILRAALDNCCCLSTCGISLSDFLCDPHNWWTPGLTNFQLASTLALEPTNVVGTIVKLLQESCVADVVLVEDWRIGCGIPDCAPLDALLADRGRLVYLSTPTEFARKLKLVAETRAFASLDEIRDMYFTWREWVFGGGVVNSTQAASEPFDRITGCLEWFGRRTSDLPFAGLQLPFKLALMLDRKMNVQRFDPVCAIPPNGALFRLSGELLPGGKAKIVGDDQYEIDVTTESRQKGTQTRYRLFIDGGDFTGKIETKIIGGRVKHRGRVDGCLTSSGQKHACGARSTGPTDWPADYADEIEGEVLVRRLANENGILATSQAGENIARFDSLEEAARAAGLGGKLLSYPPSFGTIPLKKQLLRRRLQFGELHQQLRKALVGSLDLGEGSSGRAGLPFRRLLRELNDQGRLQHNLRSRQIMNAMSKLQNLRPDVGMKITFAEFSDTVHKAMKVAPPSRLLALTEYEDCGGTAAVFDHYYAVTVPKLVVPLMDRADVHVQHDERWQVIAVDYRDRQDQLAVLCVAWSPDGEVIASGNADGCARLWVADTGAAARTLRGHVGSVVSVAFVSDGHSLLTASTDGTVRVWPVRYQSADIASTFAISASAFAQPLPPVVLGHPQPEEVAWATSQGKTIKSSYIGAAAVAAIAVEPDGLRFASACGDKLLVWRGCEEVEISKQVPWGHQSNGEQSMPPTARSWAELSTLPGLQICTEGRNILLTPRSAALGLDLNGHVWDGMEVPNPECCRAADVFRQHEILASTDNESTQHLVHKGCVEVLTGCTAILPSGHGDVACLSWGGTLVAGGCREHTVMIWQVPVAAVGPPTAVAVIPGHPAPLKSLAFSSHDALAPLMLVTATAAELFVWRRCDSAGGAHTWEGAYKWKVDDDSTSTSAIPRLCCVAWIPVDKPVVSRRWDTLTRFQQDAAILLSDDKNELTTKAKWQSMTTQDRLSWLDAWVDEHDAIEVCELKAAEDAIELLLADWTQPLAASEPFTMPSLATAIDERVIILTGGSNRRMKSTAEVHFHSLVTGVCVSPSLLRCLGQDMDGKVEVRCKLATSVGRRLVLCAGLAQV